MTTPATVDSTIHDIGYQRYTGPRLGRAHAVAAIYLYSVRSAFGLGRTAKAKIFPFLIAGIMLVVAVVLAAVRAQFGITVLTYLDFPARLSFLVVLFLAIVSPELVSRDLRNKTLPLYFSRPIGRDDYVLAKLAASVTAVTVLIGVPLLVMFLAGLFTVHGGHAMWTEFTDFLPGLLNVLLYAILLGALTLLIASFSGRRTIAAGAIVAVFLVTSPVSAVLSVLGKGAVKELAWLFSPTGILVGLRTWVFGASANNPLEIGSYGPLYAGVAVLITALCTVLLVYRYRKVAA
jgi:ABC-2 type transport system permease protein